MRLVVPPALPFTVADAKAHTRIDHDADDAQVEQAIKAAVAYLDGWTGVLHRALMPQTWEATLDGFPSCRWRFPIGPVVSVEAIVYDDEDGDEQTFTDFGLVDGRLWLGDTPSLNDQIGAVRVRWVAGTGCRENEMQALYILTTHFYDNRDGSQPAPNVHWLIGPGRAGAGL